MVPRGGSAWPGLSFKVSVQLTKHCCRQRKLLFLLLGSNWKKLLSSQFVLPKAVFKKKNQHRGGDWVLRAHLSCCTPSCDPGPPNCPWRIKVDSKTAKPRALFQVGGEGSFRSFNSRSGWWKKRLERSGRLESPASAFSLSECKVPLKLVGWHEFLSSLFLFLFLSFFPYLFSSFLSKGKPNRSQDLCTASGKNVLNVSLTAHRSFQISSGWDSST